MEDHGKAIVDGLAVGVTVGAVLGWLPAVAALFTILWTVIRIYETKTIQNILKWLKLISDELE